MKAISLVYPNQLFESHPALHIERPVYLVEEYLFFTQYRFHQQKLAFHRATMKAYESHLKAQGFHVIYVECAEKEADTRQLLETLVVGQVHFVDPVDNYLSRRLHRGCERQKIQICEYPSPGFINSSKDLEDFFQPTKKKYFQTDFYIRQRKKNDILIDGAGNPLGGKWTYDVENRKKYPRGKIPPVVHYPETNEYYEEAITYVKAHFPENPGTLAKTPRYPIDFISARSWLNQFLEIRFSEFGDYEDAIVASQGVLNHSVLSPLINCGLLTPREVVNAILDFAHQHTISLNNTEGIVRQIIGWREFIRGVYEVKGTEERTRNFWGFTRKIPNSFYEGTTGIAPVDITIKKLLATGYNHHIERLMVLGNFMMLCELDPDEVYRWFMEMYIDAYDWVMVPNVYGMSQFADGGLMSTKPYISGSNYLRKMSDFKRGDWEVTWDGLFWRFMDVHREFFLKNPRLGMLIRTFDKMPEEKKRSHHQVAEAFLSAL